MEDESQTPNILPLEYGRQAKRLPRWWRKIVLAILLVGLLGVSWRWGKPYVLQGMYLRTQQKCLDYSLSRDQIVFDSIPDEAQELLKKPGYKEAPNQALRDSNWDRTIGAGFLPQPFVDFSNGHWPPMCAAVAFMHERQSSIGNHRLVIVHISKDQTKEDEESAVGEVFPVENWDIYRYFPHSACGLGGVNPGWHVDGCDLLGTRCRIHAGQVDPSDAAHFTIDVDRYDDKTGIWYYGYIDGRLLDNDDMTLENHLYELPK